jgi:hypothetical protein
MRKLEGRCQSKREKGEIEGVPKGSGMQGGGSGGRGLGL